jgi:NAD(P)-dependent dehydrogenase (short-subunit alcohol dehydrogenase family)
MILRGKRALVTGGAVRIGKAIVEALQGAGVEVVVHYRHSAAEAQALSPFTVQADLQSMDECSRLIERAGRLDILVNNASLFTKDSLSAATPDRVLREFQINLFAPMELLRKRSRGPWSICSTGASAATIRVAFRTPSPRKGSKS